MENFVITTFTSEQQANEGLKKLQELDQIGDIIIYDIALVKKGDQNNTEVIYHLGSKASNLPAGGAIAGSLIGAIAGPIGMALGMLTGVMVGAADEDTSDDVSQQFLYKTGRQLAPGTFALLMDVEEFAALIIDSYMTTYEGTTVHTSADSHYDQYELDQWDELDKEIDEEEKALKTAVDKDKAHISARIDELKKKRAKEKEKIKEKATRETKHWQDKIKTLNAKISHAGEKTKEKLKAQQQKLEKDLEKYNEAVAFAFV